MEAKQYLIQGRDYFAHIDGQIKMYDLLLTMVQEVRGLLMDGQFSAVWRSLCEYEHQANEVYLNWGIPDEYLCGGSFRTLRKLVRKELREMDSKPVEWSAVARKYSTLQFTGDELPPKPKHNGKHSKRAVKPVSAKKKSIGSTDKPVKSPEVRNSPEAQNIGPDGPKKPEQSAKKEKKRLLFEDDRPAPPVKLRHEPADSVSAGSPSPSNAPKGKKSKHTAADGTSAKPRKAVAGALCAAPVNVAAGVLHRGVSEHEDENVGVESAHKLEQGAESGVRFANHSIRAKRLKSRRNAREPLEKPNVGTSRGRSTAKRPRFHSNPLSRWRQKRAIQRQYAANLRAAKSASISAAKKSEKAVKAAENGVKAAKRAAEESARQIAFFIWRHKLILLIISLAVFGIAFLSVGISSCSTMVQSGVAVVGNSTYTSRDEDILGAEDAYAAKETELQSYLDNYESTHSYDEYHYNLDEIKHDPYVLISLVSSLHPGEWTLEDVGETLETLFQQQYILTETVRTETRQDSDGNSYTWTICTVTLENTDLARQTATMLDEDGLHLYATYMATRGNRPDLFPVSDYPNASGRQDYVDYDVPPEALEDETFAAMLAEAEKYLGYPYVWGGTSPSTSFDCSGYVSWVINHSGWNFGRLTAQGLFNVTTPVSAANAKPGDLVFFKGTYNTTEVSHVGIYVGNHRMIHCGDPISYADLNENYWQVHMYCYGRLP